MQVFGCEITGAGGKEIYCSSAFSFVLLFLKSNQGVIGHFGQVVVL